MFWTREVVGWGLLAFGAYLFYCSYFVFLKNNKIFESGPTVLMGIIVFRGGIQLLKVAVAARVCQQNPAESNKVAEKAPVVRRTREGAIPGKRNQPVSPR
jgi:hypothetical protein